MSIILMISDNVSASEGLCSMLNRLGHECALTPSSKILAPASGRGPELVVIDIEARKVRESILIALQLSAAHPLAPLYLLEPADEDELLGEAGLAKGSSYLVKPFSERELQQAIELALCRQETALKLKAAEEELRAEKEQAARVLGEREERLRVLEEELRESKAFLDKFVNSISDPIFVKDQEHRIVLANDAVCALAGRTREEMIGKRGRDFFPKEQIDSFQRNDVFVFATGKDVLSEEVLTGHSGIDHLFLAKRTLYQEGDGAKFIIGILRDITLRRRMEQELREERELFIEGPNVVFKWKATEEWPVEYVSPNLKARFGYDPADFTTGKIPYAEIVHPDDLPRVTAEVKAYSHSGATHFEQEYRIRRADGQYRWVHDFTIISRNAAGEIRHYHGYILDISARKHNEELLRWNESLLRETANSAPLAYYIVDFKTDEILFFTHQFCVMWGLEHLEERMRRGEVNNQGILPACLSKLKDFPAFDAACEPLRGEANRQVTTFEIELVDGRIIRCLSAQLRDDSDRYIGRLCIYEDITQRKLIEETNLQSSLSLLRATLESTADGLLVVDHEGRVVSYNQQFVKMWRIPEALAEAADDERLREYVTDQVARPDQFEARVLELYTTPDLNSYDQIEFKDGRTFERFSRPQEIKGEIVGRVWSFRDITGRRQSELALKESERRYRSLFDHAPVSLWEQDFSAVKGYLDSLRALGVIDFETFFGEHPEAVEQCGSLLTTTDVNKAAINMFKAKDKEELIGNLNNVFTPKSKEILRHILIRIAEGKTSLSAEDLNHSLSGEAIHTYLTWAVAPDYEDTYARTYISAQDITEHKRLESQLMQSQKLEAVGRLAGGIAHDFNNLLTGISGYADLAIYSAPPQEPLRSSLLEIQKATARAGNLTRQLLAFSRRQVVEPRKLDLDNLIVEIQKMLDRLIGEDIDLVVSSATGLGWIKADPGQVEQVIMNLVINARDAMPTGGKILIETANIGFSPDFARLHPESSSQDYVMLAVSDTGSGMTGEQRAHIFEPFYTTKEPGKGTGLGLATVYGIVNQAGGFIDVYSKPGLGSAFKIYFPRVATPIPVDDEAQVVHDLLPRGDETILLVEDEKIVCDLTANILRRQGYQVLVAHDGREAIKLEREHAGQFIDLLLADIVLPDLKGNEVAGIICPLRPGIKVLFTSGYTEAGVTGIPGLMDGVNFIPKPFSPASLARRVREILDE